MGRRLLCLLLLVGCSAAPAPAPAPPVPSAGRDEPATFSFFYEYTPGLVVGLLRNGRPFDGEAQLRTRPLGPLSWSPGGADPLGASEGVFPVMLAFDDKGKTGQFFGEILVEAARAPALWLRTQGQEFELVYPRSQSPFRCALAIEALDRIDPCASPLPDPAQAPDACDWPGRGSWSAVRENKQVATEHCFSDAGPGVLAPEGL